jgi:four helix bundle protein
MATGNLDNFGGYKKALRLFDAIAEDCVVFREFPELRRLISQQLAAADSVCANMEEGYGRGSRKEFIQFLLYSRGSANEVRGRCKRMGRWQSKESLGARVRLAEEVIALLTTTIETLRKKLK